MSKASWKDIFCRISINSFRKQIYFYGKKPVLHTTTLTHWKARQVFRDPFSTNQRNSSDMIFVAGITKINLKNLKNLKASII